MPYTTFDHNSALMSAMAKSGDYYRNRHCFAALFQLHFNVYKNSVADENSLIIPSLFKSIAKEVESIIELETNNDKENILNGMR